MTCVIFTGGILPDFKLIENYFLSLKNKFVIAADSGLDYCENYKIRPDRIIGDMDSISQKDNLSKYGNSVKNIFPHDKDDTDTELALKLAKSSQCSEIILIGGGEGRLDHSLAIFSLFYKNDYCPDRWITGMEECFFIQKDCQIIGKPGDIISFFSTGEQAAKMESEGLKWSLDGLIWERGSFGISNEMITEKVKITVNQGSLLGIKALYEGCHVPGFQ